MGSSKEPPKDGQATGKNMNNPTEIESDVNSTWECIDPVVGRCIWELEVEETTDERAKQLRAHMQLCDACRLDGALEARLEKGLSEGQLVLPGSRVPIWWQRPSLQATAGTALIAACLTLLMLMPPAPTGDFVRLRGMADDPHFIRPVEGELVVASTTELTWQPIDGATSYQVILTDVAGDFQWVGSTKDTRMELPVLDQDQQTLRAVLSTVPADLVSPGRVSVSFSTGSWAQMAQDRMLKAPWWATLCLMGGVLLLGLSLFSKQRRLLAE